MRILRRIFLWLVGLALLVGTVAGANWILNRTEAARTSSTAETPASITVPFGGKGIAATGYVDVLPGIANLYPTHPGRVVWVAEEGQAVAAGEVILKMDDRLVRQKRHEAEIALANARLALQEAKLLPQKQQEQIKQVQAAIASLKHKREAVQQEAARETELLRAGHGSQFKHRAFVESVKEIEALVHNQERKIAEVKLLDPQISIQQAELDIKHKEILLEEAELALDECTLKAPTDGTILRSYTQKGELLGSSPKTPALQFRPAGALIVRAEVMQEWAEKLRVGQDAIVEDDTTSAYQWTGKVKSISDWYTQRRSIIQEPFQFNDVRTLEAIIEVTTTKDRPLRIGQRMRVLIAQGGP